MEVSEGLWLAIGDDGNDGFQVEHNERWVDDSGWSWMMIDDISYDSYDDFDDYDYHDECDHDYVYTVLLPLPLWWLSIKVSDQGDYAGGSASLATLMLLMTMMMMMMMMTHI